MEVNIYNLKLIAHGQGYRKGFYKKEDELGAVNLRREYPLEVNWKGGAGE